MQQLGQAFDEQSSQQSPQTQSRADAFVVEVVKSDERFAELAEPWQRLEADSSENFIFFQSFDWCFHWWQTVGQRNPDASLQIMVLWQNGQLVAVWPLMIDVLTLGTRALVPMTSPHAEYTNLVFDCTRVNQTDLTEFVDKVVSNFKGDLISLPKIPTGSALQVALQDHGELAPTDEVASIFDLGQFDGFEKYQASISKSTRRNRNKRKNKLARLGDLSYQTHFAGSKEYEQLVETALEMKRDWLGRTGRNDSKLTIDGLVECITGLSGDRESKFGAVAGALVLDGKPVAVEVGFLQRGHYYSYIGAFDWEMREHSVGKVQIEEAIRWAIENGATKYDLLAEPAGYKDSWSNGQLMLQTRVVPRSARGHIVGVLWQLRLRPLAKTVFNQMPGNWRLKLLQLVRTLRGQGSDKAS